MPPEESIAYHGINFSELVEREGLERATARYARDGRHAFLPVRFMERVLQDLRPDIVIQRLFGISDWNLLIAPNWGLTKSNIQAYIEKEIERREIIQGSLYKESNATI